MLHHVRQLGPETGPPLLMLHGLLVGNLASWYFGAGRGLAERHRVTLYDLRGHGHSEQAPDGYTVAALASDLAALVELESPDRPVRLVGHSYGALIALRYALDHPERVERLALVEAPLPPSRMGELLSFLERSPEQMLQALPEDLRHRVAGGGRRARRFLARLGFLARESSLLADLAAEGDILDEELTRLATPTLAIFGDSSQCRPVGTRLERVLPHCQLVELEGGHYLPAEAPGALEAALCSWFEDERQRGSGRRGAGRSRSP